jgi:hypothetical protein
MPLIPSENHKEFRLFFSTASFVLMSTFQKNTPFHQKDKQSREKTL